MSQRNRFKHCRGIPIIRLGQEKKKPYESHAVKSRQDVKTDGQRKQKHGNSRNK
jgi:hypothetical protein